MSQFFTSGGQSIGVSASASVLPMNTQDWFPLGWIRVINCSYVLTKYSWNHKLDKVLTICTTFTNNHLVHVVLLSFFSTLNNSYWFSTIVIFQHSLSEVCGHWLNMQYSEKLVEEIYINSWKTVLFWERTKIYIQRKDGFHTVV